MKASETASLEKDGEEKKATLEKAAPNGLNLEKLGEKGGSPDKSAELLKKSLAAKEKSQVWGRHQTWLKNNPQEQPSGEVSKAEKGQRAAAWLLQSQGKQYLHPSRQVSAIETVKKNNTWESEKQMLDKFDWNEFEAHLASGRIQWREDPTTPGFYNYKDTQSYTGELSVGRGNHWHQGMEVDDPAEEHGERFDQLFYTDAMNLGIDDIAGKGSGKSFGKGKGKDKGKDGRKGKSVKGKREQLALEDGATGATAAETNSQPEEPTEEDLLKEALKKARRGRDQVASAQSDLEEALGKATDMLSSKGKATAQGWLASLASTLQELKKVLSGKDDLTSSEVKSMLEEAAETVKGAKEETRELMQLANKEGSVVNKRARR